jgi:hypothetical protein
MRRTAGKTIVGAKLLFASAYAIHITTRVVLLHLLAFIVQFHTFAQCHFTFGDTSVGEIHSQRYEREPFLFRSTDELQHFPFMDEQLSGAFGFVIPYCCLGVLGNVAANQPQGVATDATVGFVELAFAIPQTLDLTAQQDHAAFDGIQDFVFVSRLAIVADHFMRGRSCFVGCFSSLSSSFTGWLGSRFVSRLGGGRLRFLGLIIQLIVPPALERERASLRKYVDLAPLVQLPCQHSLVAATMPKWVGAIMCSTRHCLGLVLRMKGT